LDNILFSPKFLLTVCLVQTKNSVWARIEGVKFPVRLTTKQGQASPVQVGTVQLFSNSKGYGFIRGQDGVERFFHVTDLTGGFIPDSGTSVLFQSKQDGKGPKAVSVCLLPDSSKEDHLHTYRNGRMFCPHCGSSIVPRLVFNYGAPIYSICHFCGKKVADFRDNSNSWLNHPIAVIILFVVFCIATQGWFAVLLAVAAIGMGIVYRATWVIKWICSGFKLSAKWMVKSTIPGK
jgi:cold shock CspA family protein